MIEKALEKLTFLQYRHPYMILMIVLVFTLLLGIGLKDIQLEGNFEEEMPQHLPIFLLNDRVNDAFSGEDTIFVLFQLKDVNMKEVPKDILDPAIMDYVVRLEETLSYESSIDDVVSVAPVVRQIKQANPSYTSQDMHSALMNSGLDSFVSDDRTKMIMMLKADVGMGNEGIIALTDLLNEKLDGLSKPPGTEITITGSPSILKVILELLEFDSVFTLLVAFVIIFFLLVIIQRSFTQAGVISVPLLLGIIWTGGTLGWLGVKISIATAGLGAMLLGLGVEYGVFMISRYKEERAKKRSQKKALSTAVPAVGSAVLGSGTTTIVGFLALTFSIMPMMQHLGFSLALGIFYCIIAAVVVEPVIMLFEEGLK
ncbi:MAG: MMPL family transporter [Candidatus Woesearchaeota archaeon]